MRYSMMAIVLLAAPITAQAQDSAWRYFETPDALLQAGVQATDGSQLILKCDKPGEGAVYAVVVTAENLVPPSNNRFSMRPVMLRFDQEGTVEERWRFYEKSAVAINQKAERTLARLLGDLADANKLTVRLNPERARWVETTFDVRGAKDAITRVYESCEDKNPYG